MQSGQNRLPKSLPSSAPKLLWQFRQTGRPLGLLVPYILSAGGVADLTILPSRPTLVSREYQIRVSIRVFQMGTPLAFSFRIKRTYDVRNRSCSSFDDLG